MEKEMYCRICDQFRSVDDFYKRSSGRAYGRVCKECHNRLEREKASLEEDDLQRVLQAPNSYSCDKQRRDTFNIMIALGWTFHKPSGVWYKDGIKDKYGRWSNVSSADIPRKTCNKCEKLLPITNFYVDRGKKCYQYICIDCKRIVRKAYYKKNKK